MTRPHFFDFPSFGLRARISVSIHVNNTDTRAYRRVNYGVCIGNGYSLFFSFTLSVSLDKVLPAYRVHPVDHRRFGHLDITSRGCDLCMPRHAWARSALLAALTSPVGRLSKPGGNSPSESITWGYCIVSSGDFLASRPRAR